MKESKQNCKGGGILYSAPELEVFHTGVEQGFQLSTVSNSWDKTLQSERSWGYTNEEELF